MHSCVCLLSISLVILEFIQIVAHISLSLFISEQYSIVWISCNVQLLDAWVVLFIMNKAAMNMCLQVFVQTYIFISLGMALLDDKHMFNFLRKCPTDFKSGNIFTFLPIMCECSCCCTWWSTLSFDCCCNFNHANEYVCSAILLWFQFASSL